MHGMSKRYEIQVLLRVGRAPPLELGDAFAQRE